MTEDQKLAEAMQRWREALQQLAERPADATAATAPPSRTELSKAVYAVITLLRSLTHERGVELILAKPLPLLGSGEPARAGRYIGQVHDPRPYRQGDTTYVVVKLQRECRPDIDIMLPDPDSFSIGPLA